jgi:hypothetical protein
MIARFFIPLVFLLSVSLDATSISTNLLNDQLKRNYSFIERSLNESEMQIGNSAGKILFKNDEVIIQVLTPFEENYRINKETIEIHDVFLDQKQTIEIDQINNFFLDLLIDGVDEGSEDYSVRIIQDSTIKIYENDSSSVINFLFIDNQLKLIRYTDSLGVEHGVELTLL